MEVQEFYTALNCSFMYAFSLCKLVFLYRYLKKICNLLYLNLLCINLGSINIPILFFFIDKMNIYNGITSCTILTLIQLYSGIFYTTFLTTRMMFIRIACFQKSISRLKMIHMVLNLLEWSWNRFFRNLRKFARKNVCITFYKNFMILELFKLENRQKS